MIVLRLCVGDVLVIPESVCRSRRGTVDYPEPDAILNGFYSQDRIV